MMFSFLDPFLDKGFYLYVSILRLDFVPFFVGRLENIGFLKNAGKNTLF